MTVNINLSVILAILSILGTAIGAIVAIAKVYGKVVIGLTNINNQQVQTNERLTKIETMLLDLDSRIDECSSDNESNAQEVELLEGRLNTRMELIEQKCELVHKKE